MNEAMRQALVKANDGLTFAINAYRADNSVMSGEDAANIWEALCSVQRLLAKG